MKTSTFPLRFRSSALRELVKKLAKQDGVSQNELIEQAVEHEALLRGEFAADDLRDAYAQLLALTEQQNDALIERSLAAFAQGEGRRDPLTGHAVVAANEPAGMHAPSDPLGVLAAFEAAGS